MKHWRVAVAAALLTGCDLVVGIEPWTAGGAGGAASSSGSMTSAAITSTSGSTTSVSSTGSGCETCGGSACIDLANDVGNCGACNVRCFGSTKSCDSGVCAAATLATVMGGGHLAVTPSHVAVAVDTAISFVSKDATVTGAAIPIPDGSITALTSFDDQVFAATGSLYSVTSAGQPKKIGAYVDPSMGSDAPLDASSMAIGQWQGSTSVLIGSKITGRPLIAAPLVPGTLANTSCIAVNSVVRVSTAGDAIARLATNDEAGICGMDALVAMNANDLALVAAPATFVLATTGALLLAEGMSLTPLLENPAFDFRLVKNRGQEIFTVVTDGSTHRVMTTKIDGNSAGTITTIYTSNAPIVDLVVDAQGVYLIDKGSNVIAIGY